MNVLDQLAEIKELVNEDKKFKYKNIVNFNCKDIEKELGYADNCHKVEGQLGCPLDVLFKAITYGIAYELKNGLIESEPHISLTECGYGYILCSGSSTRKVIENGEFQTKDYKKTWWLKEDKSE